MRVTFVNKYYPPHLGGIEYHLRDLAEALAKREGFAVRAVVANEGARRVEERVNGVEVVRLPRAAALASTPIALGMSRELRRRTAATDVFHLHFPYPWGDFSWLLAGAPGPAVLTYHSDIVRQKGLLKLYQPVLRRALAKVDLVIASSPNMIEHSSVLAPIAEKCRVVPFGIDVAKYAATPQVEARAARLRQPHQRPIVLFVGRLIYYKGADVLVRAMAQVDADLVMIGAGPLEPELHELAREAGIADRVTFLAPVGDDELVAWYHAADVFCLPSVARSEAFGLVQLEAHSAGTPVVSTNLTTGVPYVNPDGVTGFTVEPGDPRALASALSRLTGDEALRRGMGQAAKQRAGKDFSIDRMVADTVAVYEEALEGT